MSDQNYSASDTVSPPAADGPVLSLSETLTGIFFEPGRVFESFRARPRFLVAALIIIAAVIAFQFLFIQRLGYENVIRAEVESRMPDMEPAQREQAIEQQLSPIVKTLRYVVPLIVIAFVFAIGGALYLLGTLAMGKSINYKQALAVWTYSSLPPGVLIMAVNILLLFIKAIEDIDPASSNRGLVRASPGILVDGSAHPVLATALGTFDLFAIYGLILCGARLKEGCPALLRQCLDGGYHDLLDRHVVSSSDSAAMLKTPMA
ncbi:MAG: YIP1 family protein [Pyrinomonadaceae bacterium]